MLVGVLYDFYLIVCCWKRAFTLGVSSGIIPVQNTHFGLGLVVFKEWTCQGIWNKTDTADKFWSHYFISLPNKTQLGCLEKQNIAFNSVQVSPRMNFKPSRTWLPIAASEYNAFFLRLNERWIK